MDGLSGDLKADVNWRWAPKAEDLYLAELAATKAAGPADAVLSEEGPASLSVEPGDWPAVRGADRDGVVHGITIGTDWERNPPQLVVAKAGRPRLVIDGNHRRPALHAGTARRARGRCLSRCGYG